MATMNVSLPDALRDFIDAKVATGNYATTSDYVRSLVRRDRISDLYEKILHAAIEKGLRSGVDPRSSEQIFADIVSGRSKARGPADPMVTGELVWPNDDEHWDMEKVWPGTRRR